jgi:hypothetical protein
MHPGMQAAAQVLYVQQEAGWCSQLDAVANLQSKAVQQAATTAGAATPCLLTDHTG